MNDCVEEGPSSYFPMTLIVLWNELEIKATEICYRSWHTLTNIDSQKCIHIYKSEDIQYTF